MPLHSRPVFALLLVVSMLAAGCGSGGGGLSETAFRKRADDACDRYNRALSGVGDARKISDIPRVLDATKPLLVRMIAELDAIKPPKRSQQDYSGLIQRARDALQTLDKLRTAAHANDIRQIATVAAAAQAADRKAKRLATDLRLPRCAES